VTPRKKNRGRRAKPSTKQTPSRRAASSSTVTRATDSDRIERDSLEELFSSLRSGAANVAGVSFQIAISALLLAVGRAATVKGLPIVAVRPEGFEDIDCDLSDGTLLLVQTKERGEGARAIAAAELAEIMAHAAVPLLVTARAVPSGAVDSKQSGPTTTQMNGGLGQPGRLAVVTDGRFGSSLPVTGWTTTLAEALDRSPRRIRSLRRYLSPCEASLGPLDFPVICPQSFSHVHI
jgi:hypothetical protein